MSKSVYEAYHLLTKNITGPKKTNKSNRLKFSFMSHPINTPSGL